MSGALYLGFRFVTGVCRKAVSLVSAACSFVPSNSQSKHAQHTSAALVHAIQWASGYTNPMRKRKLISDWQRLQVCIVVICLCKGLHVAHCGWLSRYFPDATCWRRQERIAIMSELLQLDAFTSSSQLGHGVVREPPFPPLGLPAASEPPAA